MKASSGYYVALVTLGAMSLLLVTVQTAPAMDTDDESSENALIARSDSNDISSGGSWDAVDAAALRKVLMQLDAEDRLGMPARVSRSWPQAEPRGWGPRSLDARMLRPWRADKRQVRFRQCYFNPISCFRK